MGKHYINEIGTDIIVDTGTDITGATDVSLKIKKPDDTTTEWDAAINDTNYLKHTTIVTDFDQAGVYYLQASLTVNGWIGLGETAEFMVHDEYA
jgi:hypothetical protein